MVLLKLAMPNKLSRSTKKQLKELKEDLDEYGDESFEVAIGAEAIRKILSELNLKEECKSFLLLVLLIQLAL